MCRPTLKHTILYGWNTSIHFSLFHSVLHTDFDKSLPSFNAVQGKTLFEISWCGLGEIYHSSCWWVSGSLSHHRGLATRDFWPTYICRYIGLAVKLLIKYERPYIHIKLDNYSARNKQVQHQLNTVSLSIHHHYQKGRIFLVLNQTAINLPFRINLSASSFEKTGEIHWGYHTSYAFPCPVRTSTFQSLCSPSAAVQSHGLRYHGWGMNEYERF